MEDWWVVPPRFSAITGLPAERLWKMMGESEDVYRCTQHGGDILLLPDNWGHSTMSHGFSMGLGVLRDVFSESHRGHARGRSRVGMRRDPLLRGWRWRLKGKGPPRSGE